MNLVITNTENISKEVANTMLKILEEPPSYLYIHLITGSEEQVISTIVSRCHRIRHIHHNQAMLSSEATSDIPWSIMTLKQKLEWSDEISKSDDLQKKLSVWIIGEKQKGDIAFAYRIEKLAMKLASTNVNKRLCIDNFILGEK